MIASVVSVPASGCLGDDACTGVDAGITMADIIDLTPGVTFTPSATGTDTTFRQLCQVMVGVQLEMTFTCSTFLGDIPLRQ